MPKTRFQPRVLTIPVGLFFVWLLSSATLIAQTFDERFETWPTDLRIRGTMMASLGNRAERLCNAFLVAAGSNNATIVNLILPGGSSLPEPDFEQDSEFRLIQIKVDTQQTELSRSETEQLSNASGIWVSGGERISAKNTRLLRSYRQLIYDALNTTKVVCFENAAAPLAGKTIAIDLGDQLYFDAGLNLIPGTSILAPHTDETRGILLTTIHDDRNLVGIGIEPDTSIVLRGRKISVLGDRGAHFLLAANDREPVKIKTMREAPGRRANPYEFLLDLTAWRRQAIDRQLPPFPPVQPPEPKVENGTLYIVGGGGLPAGMMRQFIREAGGDQANLVYVPCTERESLSREPRILNQWREMGVTNAILLHTKDRNRSNSNEEFLKPLRNATGIWFGGGRQWNFSDSYYGTETHRLMKEVLRRGGVIGGSSAGASIQGRYLARANPLANFDIMAAGYERGLGFLSGVAIDQHFSQRGRQKDLTQLVNRYPQLLGIGIDETTALIVKQSVGQVMGKGKVHFYDRTRPVLPEQPDYIALPDGYAYDLVERQVIGTMKNGE